MSIHAKVFSGITAAFLLLALGAADALAGGKISGKVVDSNGNPAADIVIKMLLPITGQHNDPNAKPKYTIKTDKDGKFLVDNADVGDYKVVFGDASRGMTRRNISVEEGKEVTLDVKLPKPMK